MWVFVVACRELEGGYNRLPKVPNFFYHKIWYLLIHAPYPHIVVFWNVSNMLLSILLNQICNDTPVFCVAS